MHSIKNERENEMKNETKKSEYICIRPKLYSLLVNSGFTPIRISPNLRNPKFLVWIFEETPELKKIVDDFYSSL